MAAAVAVAGCTGTTGPRAHPPTSHGQVGHATGDVAGRARCAPSRAATQWVSLARTRALTEARLLQVDPDGRETFIPLAGLPGRITPEMVQSSGPKVSFPGLLALLGRRLPVQSRPGPPLARASELDQGVPAGNFIIYTGADRIQAIFDTFCNGRPATGSLSTWMAPAVGIVQCDTLRKPPADSTGALAISFCPPGND